MSGGGKNNKRNPNPNYFDDPIFDPLLDLVQPVCKKIVTYIPNYITPNMVSLFGVFFGCVH
eukprot:UN28811